MEIGKTKLALTASALAMALMLAGCGGSSSSGGVSSAAGGSSGTPPAPTQPEEDTGEQKVAAALEVGADALKAGQKAVSTATQSKKDAAKYVVMLSALSVEGESADAVTNAQKVLDAESMLAADIKAAEDEVADAIEARADVSGDDLKTLNADIMEAEADIKATKEDLKAVKVYADMIRVSSKAPFKNAAYHGDKAAQDIGKLIMENPAAESPRMASDEMQPKYTFMDDNSTGMTFSEIAGAVTKRIDTTDRQVTSLAGMKATDIWSGDGAAAATTVAAGDENDTPQGTGTKYKGISGGAYCLSDDGCKINTDGTLGSGWYFAIPTNRETAKYVMKDGEKTYSEEMFAYFGYWLTMNTTPSPNRLELTTFAVAAPGTNTTGFSLAADDGHQSTMATYKGEAAGLSLTKDRKSDGSGFMNHKSGRFTADVTLTADFSGSGDSNLRGIINGFAGGDHVNTEWEVTLEQAALADNTASTASTVASGGDGTDDGAWTARGYGPVQTGPTHPSVNRPTGFFGNFNAHFVDGHAMGSYVTDK